MYRFPNTAHQWICFVVLCLKDTTKILVVAKRVAEEMLKGCCVFQSGIHISFTRTIGSSGCLINNSKAALIEVHPSLALIPKHNI